MSFESRGRQAAAGGRHNPIAVRSTAGLAAILVVRRRPARTITPPFWQAVGNLIRDPQSPHPSPGLQPARSEPRPLIPALAAILTAELLD